MKWFSSKIKNTTKDLNNETLTKFGRFSDSYKHSDQYLSWTKSLEAFEKKLYIDSFQFLVHYMNNQKANSIVIQEQSESLIKFYILHGSKKIEVTIQDDYFEAYVKIVKASQLNIGYLRRLVEQNFDLHYCRYALDCDNIILLKFESPFVDASPYKIYFALKEMATKADKDDDLLLAEFEMLEEIESGHKVYNTLEEKESKYNYLMSTISQLKTVFDDEDGVVNYYPAAASMYLLSKVYTLDYLLKPEGNLMHTFEVINSTYFLNDTKNIVQKNNEIKKELLGLTTIPKEEYFLQFYNIPFTFGITTPQTSAEYSQFVLKEIIMIDDYISNNNIELALAVANYIVGYTLFNNAPPKPINDLLRLYQCIIHADFFDTYGQSAYYDEKGVLDKSNIKSAINDLKEKNEEEYPNFDPDVNLINFTEIQLFVKSFLLMTTNLDCTKKS
ncbi:MAG: hypothetical protein KBA06_03770 [Saprospiraceae bacterium]|nr:hypothetical protein [Saprospiraceae bacterium]